MPAEVEAAFATYPAEAQTLLRAVRDLIFTLSDDNDVGPLRETLKWGQPAYLTEVSKAGSTLRLGTDKTGRPTVFLNCNTTLVEGYRTDFPSEFAYSGNRALHLEAPLNQAALAQCLSRALTYHRRKRRTAT